jgi:hypothetical protein
MFTRVFAFVAIAFFAIQGVAAADQPLRERRHIDVDVLARGASAVCGFPIRVHIEGDLIDTVFYDSQGNIIREVDVFPNLKLTVYRPGTNIGYTTASPAVLTQYYTDGAALGSQTTAYLTGLVQKIPGIDLDSGRAVLTGTVIGYDAAGVPVNRFTIVSTVGPDLDASQAVQRCAYFQ